MVKKLKVSKSHGYEFQEGTKMASSVFLTGAKGITGVRGVEHPFTFEYIMLPSKDFHALHMTKDDHIIMSNFHGREACKQCKKSSCKNCDLMRV